METNLPTLSARVYVNLLEGKWFGNAPSVSKAVMEARSARSNFFGQHPASPGKWNSAAYPS